MFETKLSTVEANSPGGPIQNQGSKHDAYEDMDAQIKIHPLQKSCVDLKPGTMTSGRNNIFDSTY